MRCDEFSVRFDELLDERREPLDDPNMAAHVAQCAECRRTAATVGAALGALCDLKAWSCGAPACELTVERIVAAIDRDQAAHAAAVDARAIEVPGKARGPASTNSTSANSVTRSTSSTLWRG